MEYELNENWQERREVPGEKPISLQMFHQKFRVGCPNIEPTRWPTNDLITFCPSKAESNFQSFSFTKW
jgi:hypothetical protein